MADDISSGVRTAEGARGAITLAEENGPEAAGTVPAEVTGGTVVVGADEHMIDPETADTRLIGTEILPGLGRRLYGWKEEERRAGRVGRHTGAVVARRRRRRWRREAARVWELRLLRESATNMFIACPIRSITSVYNKNPR
jgi:hypothetical protein